MRLLDKILVLFLVSTSIFRIDLASGKLGFVLTPALVLAILLVFILLAVLLIKKNLNISRQTLYLSGLLIITAAWFLVVTVIVQDLIQLKRLVLFYIIIASTISFFILLHYSVNKVQVVQKFVFNSLYVYIIFCLFQIFFFINGKHFGVHAEPLPLVKLYPASIGTYFPRLNGGFIDPNVGGYFLTFLFILIYQFNLDKKFNWVIITLIFLTLSRSAILAFIIVLILIKVYAYYLKHKDNIDKIKLKKKRVYNTLIACLLFILTTIYILFNTNIGQRIGNALSARLGNEDNSTSIHFGLFKIAADKILDNPVNFVKGYGFGSSFLYTQTYFPNNKYGNFHSELITIFVETGFIGFLLFLCILIIPLLQMLVRFTFSRNFYYVLIILSIFLQNIFYQQYLFQYYWIIIGFVWYFQDTNHKKQLKAL